MLKIKTSWFTIYNEYIIARYVQILSAYDGQAIGAEASKGYYHTFEWVYKKKHNI